MLTARNPGRFWASSMGLTFAVAADVATVAVRASATTDGRRRDPGGALCGVVAVGYVGRMRLPIKARHVPARLATGAFILNSGLSKRGLGREAAEGYHGMAKTAYPFLGELDAQDFTRMLSTAEIAVGTTLLLPMVPTALAGAALAGFSGGLVGLYLRVPGMRQEGSLRPTEKGIPLAKDWWMLGIGLGFLIDGLFDRGR